VFNGTPHKSCHAIECRLCVVYINWNSVIAIVSTKPQWLLHMLS